MEEQVTIRYSLADFDPINAGLQIVTACDVDSVVAKLRREGWTIRSIKTATAADIEYAAYRMEL